MPNFFGIGSKYCPSNNVLWERIKGHVSLSRSGVRCNGKEVPSSGILPLERTKEDESKSIFPTWRSVARSMRQTNIDLGKTTPLMRIEDSNTGFTTCHRKVVLYIGLRRVIVYVDRCRRR